MTASFFITKSDYIEKINNAEFNLLLRLSNKHNSTMFEISQTLSYYGLKLQQNIVLQHKKREMLKN